MDEHLSRFFFHLKKCAAARANLERAAQWIAEEVVNDKWQS